MIFAPDLEEVARRLERLPIDLATLRSERGGDTTELIRHAVVAYCYRIRHLSLTDIAGLMQRNRSTIYRSIRRHEDYLSTSGRYKQIYDTICQ